MTALGRPIAALVALLALLTYLLLSGAAPDQRRREQPLALVDALVFDQAALERDALKIRAGLLANYDPLVDTVERMRLATRRLREIEPDEPEIAQRLTALERAVRDQGTPIETIKSSNALVRNSLAYFIYLVGQKAATPTGREVPYADLATAMLRFTAGDGDLRSADLARWLTVLAGSPDEMVKAIVSHGRMILERMPVLDRSLDAVIHSPVEPTAMSLRALLVARYDRMNFEATVSHVLLFVAAILLLGYLSFLYLKARRNAAVLGQRTATLELRSAYQSLVAELSTSFIDVPEERIRDAIEDGLARLGRQLPVDRAYLVVVPDRGQQPERPMVWAASGRDRDVDWPLAALDLVDRPEMAGRERDGCIAVRSVAELPEGGARRTLETHDVTSWLAVSSWRMGRRTAVFGLDLASGARDWHSDTLQHMRVVGDIFAHALDRQRGERERKALNGRLVQAERTQAIGTLAGGIAHNFNNILGVVLGYAAMGIEELDGETKARRYLEEIRKAGTRAKHLVDQILTVGRRSGRQRAPVAITAVLRETLTLLSAILPASVTVRTMLVDRSATVLGDSTQLQQVIMNLCTNAAQAMNGLGQVEITVSTVEIDEDAELSHGTAAAGRHVRLAVADEGHGMDQATLARIFEPFFTTKLIGRGTGLGLATVHAIVADHGGALNVESLAGERTVFEVYLPAAEATADAPWKVPAPVHRGSGQTILLVDDEESLVLLGEEMLAALGYEPVGVADPCRALEIVAADPSRFDLVLCDEVMPDLMGHQLASRIAALRPGLPILLMTGYGSLVEPSRLRATGIREILHKPLTPSDLAAALSRQFTPEHHDAQIQA